MNRNAESHFSTLPEADIQRSRFDRSHQHKTTFNAGELIPIFVDEVLPADTITMDMSTLIRMTTPIFPTMDNAFLDIYFFFIPNRLVWDHWKEFNGENTTGYWTQPVDYQVPQLRTVYDDVDDIHGFDKGSLGDYFGIPTGVDNLSFSALPFRAYVLTWNEFFRDQNVMAPAYFVKTDTDYDAVNRDHTQGGTMTEVLQNALFGSSPLPVSKYHDYFTSCLPAPQKGPAVDLPLYQDSIPVFTGPFRLNRPSQEPLLFNPIGDQADTTREMGLQFISQDTYQAGFISNSGGAPVVGGVVPNNLYADVSNVAVATISQLRQAFQIQRLLEKSARFGSRYRETLKGHFGVTSPDARQQVPEYLGGKRIPINVDQVLQTSSTDSTSPQGNTAAYSMTTDIDSSFTKSFTEHGIILGLACVRTEHSYQQGLERFWSRKSKFDYYWPTLAHISEQAVLVKEIYATGSDHDDDAFGYQEAWADYRYKPSRVSGAFRSNYAQTLDSWHYADYYTGGNDNFVLGAEWLKETSANIDRTLAVPSSTEDQFIADFYFKAVYTRPMPLYSVPGLVDHY